MRPPLESRESTGGQYYSATVVQLLGLVEKVGIGGDSGCCWDKMGEQSIIGEEWRCSSRWTAAAGIPPSSSSPVHPLQESNMVSTQGFDYRGHHLVCPQDKILSWGRYHNRDGAYQYMARQKDCQACPIKNDCLPPGQKRRYIGLTMYHPLHLRARERNRTATYHREHIYRRIVAEGTFASLNRLSWARSRLRGLWKVDCEGYMAALAHNVLKMARKLSRGVGTPGPASPVPDITAGSENTQAHAESGSLMPPQYRLRRILWTRALTVLESGEQIASGNDFFNKPFSAPLTKLACQTNTSHNSSSGSKSSLMNARFGTLFFSYLER